MKNNNSPCSRHRTHRRRFVHYNLYMTYLLVGSETHTLLKPFRRGSCFHCSSSSPSRCHCRAWGGGGAVIFSVAVVEPVCPCGGSNIQVDVVNDIDVVCVEALTHCQWSNDVHST